MTRRRRLVSPPIQVVDASDDASATWAELGRLMAETDRAAHDQALEAVRVIARACRARAMRASLNCKGKVLS